VIGRACLLSAARVFACDWPRRLCGETSKFLPRWPLSIPDCEKGKKKGKWQRQKNNISSAIHIFRLSLHFHIFISSLDFLAEYLITERYYSYPFWRWLSFIPSSSSSSPQSYKNQHPRCLIYQPLYETGNRSHRYMSEHVWEFLFPVPVFHGGRGRSTDARLR